MLDAFKKWVYAFWQVYNITGDNEIKAALMLSRPVSVMLAPFELD